MLSVSLNFLLQRLILGPSVSCVVWYSHGNIPKVKLFNLPVFLRHRIYSITAMASILSLLSYKNSSCWRGISLKSALQCPTRGPMVLPTKKRLFCAMEIHSKRRHLSPLPRSSSCSYYSSLSPSPLRQSDLT